MATVHPSPGTTPSGGSPDLAAFVSENPNPVLSCGPDGKVTYANPAARRLAAELGLGSPAGLLPPGHEGRVRACLAAGRPQQRIEASLEGRMFSWNYLPVLGGTAVHVYGGEITDLVRVQRAKERLESRLRERERLESLGMLAAGLAHDFNNLHMVIQGNADLALLRLPPGSAARDALERIAAASRRASELVFQMLVYAGCGGGVPEPVDLNPAVQEALKELRPLPPGVDVRVRPGRPSPRAWVDPVGLRVVVVNLLTNAVEAAAEGRGSVTVRTGTVVADRAGLAGAELGEEAREGPCAFVDVADTGPGMTPEVRRRMFEPFFSTRFLGRGMGLSVVWGVVRQHRGAIRVDTAPGRGTRVRVVLPASAPISPFSGPGPRPPGPGTSFSPGTGTTGSRRQARP